MVVVSFDFISAQFFALSYATMISLYFYKPN